LTNAAGRKIAWKFVLLPLAAIVAYLAYALFALNRTFSALASGEAGAVETYADLDSLRASLKAQIDAEISRSNAGLARRGANIGEVIGVNVLSAFESGLAKGLIDAFVTPEGLAKVLAGKRDARQGGGERGFLDMWKNVHVENLNTIRFSRQQGFDVVFRFDGLSWKLVDARVPFQDLVQNRADRQGR